MKETATAILRNLGRVLGALALGSFVTVGTAFADNISKTFEFGAGLPQLHSSLRSFNIPCSTPGGIAAVVKFQRIGPDGANYNIPIIIELREPDTAVGQEGPLVETKTANATKTEQTVSLFSPSSTRGCSLPWRVRVKYASDGTAPFAVSGTIRLDFDGRRQVIHMDEYFFYLQKGESKTKTFGTSGGFQQGKIEIRAGWYHAIGAVMGPNPIKLKWDLIDPSGTVVKTAEGYSSDEARAELPKFKLTYQLANRVPGQWKVKVTNTDSNDDAKVIRYLANEFTPACP